MFVAVMDQPFGTSTFFCSKITSPDSLVIAAVRYSHSTVSKGDVPSRVKHLRNSSPFWVLVRLPFPSAFLSRTSSFMDVFSSLAMTAGKKVNKPHPFVSNILWHYQHTTQDIASRGPNFRAKDNVELTPG